MKFSLIFALFLIQLCESLFSTYFDVQFDRLELIFQDENFADFSKFKVRKINKTRALVGEFTYKVPFGNDILMEGKLLKKQGGEYRYLPYHSPKKPYCDANVEDHIFYPDWADGSDIPKDPSICPHEARTYKVPGIVFKLESAPKLIVPSGDYGIETFYYKDEALILHYRLFASVVQV